MLVRQYRYLVNQLAWELPGGKVDEGETPEQAAVREAIESGMKSRAIYLERGIRELLADPSGTEMAKSFYEHPVISSLYRGTYHYQGGMGLRGRGLPTYIPAKNFAEAIIDLAIRGPVQQEYAASHIAADSSVSTLRANITRLKNPNVDDSPIHTIR